ncbi:MAG TPA: carboxylate-amine ligase [Xanthobacteraceae bacterium]|nr:carboxylate-amine ligase [Xanthobacteraceae bacterium]
MEFRFDCNERRLRIRTLIPAGQHARTFVVDDLFQFGIEEEYFLSDAQTLQVPSETPDALFKTADFVTPGHIGREFLQAQIEVATEPHCVAGDSKLELKRLRQNAAAAAAQHGLVILACGTHPLAFWRESVQSPKERYAKVMDELQMIGQRNMLCGMHVHVEFPDPARRVDVMSRMLPYLPIFIALSASSPFWQGRATGLKGYRLAAYDELPRTGLPELFRNNAEYDAYVAAMVGSNAMEDASHLWWAIRPSLKYPTLELRAPDCCTRLDDTIAIAALYRTLARYLYANPDHNAELDVVDRAIAIENKWRAQRHGVQGSFVTRSGGVALGETLNKVLELVAADADALGCAEQVEHCRAIAAAGTSADAQLRIFTENKHEGAEIALHKVSRWIRDATLAA